MRSVFIIVRAFSPDAAEELQEIRSQTSIGGDREERFLQRLIEEGNFPLSEANTIVELRQQVTVLSAAMLEIIETLQQLKSAQNTAVIRTPLEDCNHWSQLIKIHIDVIRHLELDAAKLGSDFPIYKRIELEERHKRVDELQQQITDNCR